MGRKKKDVSMTEEPAKTVPVMIKVPEDYHCLLRIAASVYGMSMSAYAVKCICGYIDEHSEEISRRMNESLNRK